MFLSIYLSSYLAIYLSHLPIELCIYLSPHLPIYLSISLPVCLSIYLPVYLQAWKRSYSARCPQVLNLTTSKTQHFCETSSCLNLTTSKTKQICETSFKNGKLRAALTASYQCVLQFSHPFVSPATNKWCQVIRSAAPVTQNHLSKSEDLMLQNATLLRTSAENASLQILFKSATPAIVFWNATKPSRFAHF